MKKLAIAALLLAAWGRPAIAADDAAEFDAWCAKARLPASVAICSDDELRRLAIERQHAYDKARAALDDAGKARLLAEQNAWVKGYSAKCGVPQDGPPPELPLSDAIRRCMVEAAKDRVSELDDEIAGVPVARRTPDADRLPEAGVDHQDAERYYLTSGYMCAAPGALDPSVPEEVRENAIKRCLPGARGTAPLTVMDVTGGYAFVCMRAGPDQRPFPFLICNYTRIEYLTDKSGRPVKRPVVSAKFPGPAEGLR